MILFYWLVFIMPLERHPIWTRSVAGMTIIKYLGLACLFYSVNYLGIKKHVPGYFRTRQAWWFLFFFILSAISYFTKGPRFSTESNPFISYLSFLMLFFVTITLIDSLVRLRWTLLAAVGSVAYAALYLLREWQKDPSSRPGWILNPNDFGAAVALCLPIAVSLLLEKRPRVERLYCLTCILVMLGGLAVAASRGGFLGVIAGLFVIIWHSKKQWRKLTSLAALVLGLGLLTVASPLGQRLFDPNRSDVGSTQIREQLWAVGLQMIKDHPVVGVGLGMFKPSVASLTEGRLNYVAHNTYLEMAAEMGIPALCIYLIMVFSTLQSLEKVRRYAAREGPGLLRHAVPGLEAGFLGCSVALFFSSMEDFKPFWLVLFSSMCLPALVSNFKRRQGQHRAKSLETPPQHRTEEEARSCPRFS